MFLVSIPLTFEISTLTKKKPTVILHLDYSESSENKIKNIEKELTSLDFDFIRKFGIPYNKQEELTNLNPTEFHVIVSDFLFDIPKEIINKTNILLVYIGSNVTTNHLIEKIYYTNINQIEYLSVKMILPSEIKVLDAKDKKEIVKENNKNLYLFPLNTLPEEVIISSLKKEIKIKIRNSQNIGFVWFEPNQDLRILINLLNRLKYEFQPMIKISKNFSIQTNQKFKSLILGYPKNITLSEILSISEKNSKILVISPDESFLKDIIVFSKVKKLRMSSEDFVYNPKLKIFNISYKYPVTIEEAIKYNFSKISSDITLLDNYGTTFHMKSFDRDFLFIIFKNISKVDVENLKVGIYSSFSYDIFTEVLKFLLEEDVTPKEILLQESAFSGERKPPATNALHIKDLNDFLLKQIKENATENILETRNVNISNWWILMVLVILLITLKWARKG